MRRVCESCGQTTNGDTQCWRCRTRLSLPVGYIVPSRRDTCSRCGKTVQRGPTSRPQIICHDCRRAQKSVKKRTNGACATCGGPLFWPAKKYCSLACCNQPRMVAHRQPKTCEICGKQFKQSGGSKPRPTCGRACGAKYRATAWAATHPRKPLSWTYIRKCSCGQWFLTKRFRTMWCSRRCRYYATSAKPRTGTIVPAICQDCGTYYERTVGKGSRIRCPECKMKYDRRMARLAKRRREARQRGAQTEPYTLAQIAERDRYQCGFCHKRVAMTKTVPHPKSPTIDHIVPLADGGDDTRANIQLAHFICNSTAGNRGIKQPALFG